MVSQVIPIPQTPSDSSCSVLIIEDEQVSRRALGLLLSGRGYRTQTYGSAEEALDHLDAAHLPRLALVDLDLPGMNGLDLIARLAALHPSVQPILITATDWDTLRQRLEGRTITYLRKPLDFPLLLSMLEGFPPAPAKG